MKRILYSLGAAAILAASVLIGLSLPHSTTSQSATPTVHGVHVGQFGAQSKVANPKPGPAMISPQLKLTAYDTTIGTSVPQSELVATPISLPDGVSVGTAGGETATGPGPTPQTAGAVAASGPAVSQRQAVTVAAEQGIPTVSTSAVQPAVLYGVLSSTELRTATELPSATVTPAQVLASSHLTYQNMPVWVVSYPGQQIVSTGRGPEPGDTPTTVSSAPTPKTTSTLYLFINATTGAYLFAVSSS